MVSVTNYSGLVQDATEIVSERGRERGAKARGTEPRAHEAPSPPRGWHRRSVPYLSIRLLKLPLGSESV